MVKIVMGGKNPLQGGTGANKNMPSINNSNSRDELNSTNRRIKMLEEKYTTLKSRSRVTEQNMLQKNKNFFIEIKTLNLELTEVKKDINELKDKILSLIKEMDSFARRENVDILKKYIDLWNPVNFVTKNDVDAIVREVIDQMRKE